MKRILILLTSLVCSAAFAGEDINKTLDADPDGMVSISNTSGSVAVKGWDRNTVQVTGELGSGVKELVFTRDGKQILVKVKIPRFNARDASADLIVHVPQRSSIEVATVSADINVESVYGTQELQAVSGDVEAEVFAKDIDIATVSGDIAIKGDLKAMDSELASVSGDIEVTGLSGEFDGATVSGDMRIVGGSFSELGANTTSGDIEISAALLPGGKLDAESVNGGINIVFTGKVAAEFDIETFNGRIKNCFGPKASRSSEYAPGVELRFTEGSGDGRVSVNTLNGNIHICTK